MLQHLSQRIAEIILHWVVFVKSNNIPIYTPQTLLNIEPYRNPLQTCVTER